MRRYWPLALVAAGLIAGLALLLLAFDIARVERELARDDARFLAQPRGAGYWDGSGLLPLDLGRRALGVRDDVAHRRVVQRFWLTRPRDTTAPTPARLAARARVQAELAAAEAKGGRDVSQIATLLGVVALLSPPDRVEQAQVLDAAAAAFRRAIARDGTNEDAKHNLESVLRLLGQRRDRNRGGGLTQGEDTKEYGGAALSRRGSGY
jgi:hypothetical protein